MYRMIADRAIHFEIAPEDWPAVEQLVTECRMELVDGIILLNGENVSDRLRTSEVTRVASLVAQIPRVRELLVQRQREIADSNNIVCEGRDQGTVAFPHAECKFFLTAQADERARRRQMELKLQGQTVDFQVLRQEQMLRDQRDAEREVAPLRPAADAIIIDTTSLTLPEVVQLLHETIQCRKPHSL